MVLLVIISAVLAVLLNALAKKHHVPRLPPVIGAIAGYVVFILIVYVATKDRMKVSIEDFGEAFLLNLLVAFASHGIGAVGAYFAARWWILKKASKQGERPAAESGGITVDPPEVKQAYEAYREAQKKAEAAEDEKGPGGEKST